MLNPKNVSKWFLKKTANRNVIALIIFTLIVSLLFGLPHLLIKNFLNEKPYSPLIISDNIPSYTIDETYVYAARTESAQRGGIFLNDPANFERRNLSTPYISETIPAKLMAVTSLISGSVSNAFILSDFLFPAIGFLLLVSLFYLLNCPLKIGIVGSLSVISGSYLLKNIQFPRSFIINLFEDLSVGRLTPFTRSFHPQVSFILVLITLILVILTLTKHREIYPILLGIATGLLFYNYIYYLAFYIAGVSFLLLLLLLFKEVEKFKKIFTSLLIALPLSIPFCFSYFQFFRSNALGFFQENYLSPLENTFWISVKIIIILILLYKILKPRKTSFIFLTSFLLGCFSLINLQFLLGKNIHLAGHIEIRAAYPLIIIALFTILGSLKINKKILNFFLGSLATFMMAYILLTNFSYSKNYFQYYTMPKAETDLYSWLNKNTDQGSVIMTAGLRVNTLILSLTHNRVFVPHSFLSFTPPEEILERIFIVNKFAGLEDNSIRSLFEETPEKLTNIKNRVWNFDACGQWYVYFTKYSKGNYYQCFVPTQKASEILYDYQSFNFDLSKLTKYRADYLVIGPYEKSFGFNQKDFESKYKDIISIAYANDSYALYKLKTPYSYERIQK